MKVLFSNKVTPEFVSKVEDISYRLGVDPSEVMFVISYETDNTFAPWIQNRIGATGLFQFLPSTAIDLGTTTDALKEMSAVDQLEYGYQLLSPYKGDMVDLTSVYQAVFYPKSLGKPDTYVFPSNVVVQNPSFFKTGNTLADFRKGVKALVYERVPSEYYHVLLKKKEISFRCICERLSLAA